ncbi:MAG: SAM-dependent methyltransferase, partial [Deltaproteobacteria bacterium]|nr:SAM-dependent methyltransferase [Deltaproteobacteria bacterium]
AGFDLVVCHALLEWVADQQKVLACLDRLLGDEAYLSLCFYNIHGTIFKNLIKGNFKKVADGDLAGFPGSLTPPHPLDPDEVERWLAQLGLRQLGKTGIRVIHDYLFPKAACSMEEILEMERKFCRREPYRSLGRYIHIPCRKISL